jgi:hypothetical protein
MAKIVKISRDDQAARLVRLMIEAGLVLKSFGPTGDYTVGPAVKAVGPSCFGLYGYGVRVPEPYQAREGTAIEVARAFVSCVGSSRARETALRSPGRPAASNAAVQIARKRAEHIRSCRAIRCGECGCP